MKLKTIIQELGTLFREEPFNIQLQLLNGGLMSEPPSGLKKNKYQLFYAEGTKIFQNIRNVSLILAYFSNSFLSNFPSD